LKPPSEEDDNEWSRRRNCLVLRLGLPNLCCCQGESKVAAAAGKAGILLLLRKASHASQDTDPVHLEREADGGETLGIGLQLDSSTCALNRTIFC